jgi:hypothetical protein
MDSFREGLMRRKEFLFIVEYHYTLSTLKED